MLNGGLSERVLYGLRCYDFIEDLLYYYEAISAYDIPVDREVLRHEHRQKIIEIIDNNSGFDLPQLDTHSIAIMMVLKFMLTAYQPTVKEQEFCVKWIRRILINLQISYAQRSVLPELHSNRKAVARSVFEKDAEYEDRSSILLTQLAELLACIGNQKMYDILYDLIQESGVNLQLAYPIPSDTLEEALFDHRLELEMCVEFSIKIPQDVTKFSECFVKRYDHIPLRTEKSRYNFLKTLAHIHYQTDLFPDFYNFGNLKPLEK